MMESGLGAKEKEKREADDGQDDDTEKGDLGRGLGTGPWACHGERGRSGSLGPWVLHGCTRKASAKCLAGRATDWDAGWDRKG